MAYSPYQYSLAKANVVGQTSQNVTNAIIDVASNIDKIVEDEKANEKVNIAYKEMLNRFADEIVSIDPNYPGGRDSAIIQARKVYHAPIKQFGAKENLKMLLSGDISAQKIIDKLTEQVKTGKQKGAVQSALQTTKGELGPEPEPGLYDLARDIGAENQLEEYREPAAREQVFQEAAKTAPDLTYKNFEEFGGKAAPTSKELSERANRESLMGYRETQSDQGQQKIDLSRDKFDWQKQMDLQKLALQKEKTYRELEDDSFDDIVKVDKMQRDWRNLQLKNNNSKRILNKAIDQLVNSGGSFLKQELMDDLKSINYEGPADIESLTKALEDTNKATSEIEETIKFVKEARGRLQRGEVKGGTEAFKKTQREIDLRPKINRASEAIDFMRNRLSPTLIQHGSLDEILREMPPNLRTAAQEKITESKNEGYTEPEIKKMILGR